MIQFVSSPVVFTAMKNNLWLAAFTALLVSSCGQESGRPGTVPIPTAEPELASSKDFGDYVVHFNAISTDQLTPEVAKSYNIVRSRNRAMLNVSILKKVTGALGESVPGSVAAQAANLNGQLKDVNIREIKEEKSIYYIADIPVSNGETLVFTVDVTPINETSRFSVRFTRQFYSD
jgi:hypothetical protein